MLLTQVNWDNLGWIYFFSISAQIETLQQLSRQKYIKLPIAGTNPRGVEISAEALNILSNDPSCLKIPVLWHRKKVDYNPYERWLELWQKD